MAGPTRFRVRRYWPKRVRFDTPHRLFLDDMLRAIDLVAEFVRDGRDAFINDVKILSI